MIRLLIHLVWTTISLSIRLRRVSNYEKPEFIIDQFKPLILDILCYLDNVVPEPEALRGYNTPVLLAVRDKYIEHEQLEWVRKTAAIVAFNLVAILVEKNSCYDQRLGYVVDALHKKGWRREPGTPNRNWK